MHSLTTQLYIYILPHLKAPLLNGLNHRLKQAEIRENPTGVSTGGWLNIKGTQNVSGYCTGSPYKLMTNQRPVKRSTVLCLDP